MNKISREGAKAAKEEPESFDAQLEAACRKIAAAKGKPISLSGSGPGWKWSLQIGSMEVTAK
jgi:hypothetical protein